ncbi:hypothetical protein NC651_000356 [Populus alba x Populus x berolinensis]|nr:hypothetical protein NC651_000356 [Populus alba x Populus x berolinensis]
MAMVHFPHPSRALRAAFWLSPLLTCAVGLLFVLISSTASLTIGVIAIVLALILSLYACWVNSRFHYATKVLSFTAASPPAKTTTLIILSNLYSCFLVSVIGGATAVGTWNLECTDLSRFLLLSPSAPAVGSQVTCKEEEKRNPVGFSFILSHGSAFFLLRFGICFWGFAVFFSAAASWVAAASGEHGVERQIGGRDAGRWSVGVRREGLGRLKEEETQIPGGAPLLSLLRRVETMREKKFSAGGSCCLAGGWRKEPGMVKLRRTALLRCGLLKAMRARLAGTAISRRAGASTLSQLMTANKIFPTANVWRTSSGENILTWQMNSSESILREEAIGSAPLLQREPRRRNRPRDVVMSEYEGCISPIIQVYVGFLPQLANKCNLIMFWVGAFGKRESLIFHSFHIFLVKNNPRRRNGIGCRIVHNRSSFGDHNYNLHPHDLEEKRGSILRDARKLGGVRLAPSVSCDTPTRFEFLAIVKICGKQLRAASSHPANSGESLYC